MNDRTLKVGGEWLLNHDPDFLIYARSLTNWDDGTPIAEGELPAILDEVVDVAAGQGWNFEISWETLDVADVIEQYVRRKGEAAPTAEQARFFAELRSRIPDLMDWYHRDADGTPWMIVSYDFVIDDRVDATLRLDYDGQGLCGGWSPAPVTADDAVRAGDIGIDTGLRRVMWVDPGASA